MAYIPLRYCRRVDLSELQDIAQSARGEISHVYSHWTAGLYSQAFDDYHILVDHDGKIYVTTDDMEEYKEHTYKRNWKAVGIAMMCGYGAIANEGRDADLGEYPPTLLQIEALAQATAVLSNALNLEINRANFMTHCEAAIEDNYGPYSGDPETRWDLWYLPDLCAAGRPMRHGGDLWRGKAAFYQREWGVKGD